MALKEEVLRRLEKAKKGLSGKSRERVEEVEGLLMDEGVEKFIEVLRDAGLSLDYLFYGNGNERLSLLIKELIAELDRLPEKDAEVIINTMIDFARRLNRT